MKDSPSPIADDEKSAACTNMTQDFKIKMNRIATNENQVDENTLERHQTDLILHQNLFDLVTNENVSTQNTFR